MPEEHEAITDDAAVISGAPKTVTAGETNIGMPDIGGLDAKEIDDFIDGDVELPEGMTFGDEPEPPEKVVEKAKEEEPEEGEQDDDLVIEGEEADEEEGEDDSEGEEGEGDSGDDFNASMDSEIPPEYRDRIKNLTEKKQELTKLVESSGVRIDELEASDGDEGR